MPPVKKIKNTFASIITGGRSPESTNENVLPESMVPDERVNDNVETSPAIELDTKAFKRKRRIEFITKPLFPTKSKQIAATTVSQAATTEDSSSLDDDCGDECDVDNTKTSDKNNALYKNFKHSHTEFVTAINAASTTTTTTDGNSNDDELVVGNSTEIDGNDCNSTEPCSNNKQRSDIHGLRTIIESKLKFLCEGRPDVSAVQAIMIQMEVISTFLLFFLICYDYFKIRLGDKVVQVLRVRCV